MAENQQAAKLKQQEADREELKQRRLSKAAAIVAERKLKQNDIESPALGAAVPCGHVWRQKMRGPGKPLAIEPIRRTIGVGLGIEIATLPDSSVSPDHPWKRAIVQPEEIWYLTHLEVEV